MGAAGVIGVVNKVVGTRVFTTLVGTDAKLAAALEALVGWLVRTEVASVAGFEGVNIGVMGVFVTPGMAGFEVRAVVARLPGTTGEVMPVARGSAGMVAVVAAAGTVTAWAFERDRMARRER